VNYEHLHRRKLLSILMLHWLPEPYQTTVCCHLYRNTKDYRTSVPNYDIQLYFISTQENFPQKENFFKCDWPTQIFLWKKILKVENFQLLTITFSENFVFVEIFLVWKWAFIHTFYSVNDILFVV
jgi:hypothetical protein